MTKMPNDYGTGMGYLGETNCMNLRAYMAYLAAREAEENREK